MRFTGRTERLRLMGVAEGTASKWNEPVKELEPAMPPEAAVRFDLVAGPGEAATEAEAACAAPKSDGTGIPLGRRAAKLVILQSRLREKWKLRINEAIL